MILLYITAIIFILIQILFVFQVYHNCRYVLDKAARQRVVYKPSVALILPCKGIDTAFDENISSFFKLDYNNYEIIFVTESAEDPAYERLGKLKEKFKGQTKAFSVRVLLSGISLNGSQKLHNMLYAVANISPNVEVLAFADSDACVRSDWINHIVYPLRQEKNGVSTGYRWYVPLKNNLATLALSAINARVTQFIGPTIFNKAWGGSMAVKVDVFRKLGIDEIWKNAASDDLTISRAVKRAKMLVAFVPACLVASFEQTNWPSFFEFARRQFLITRVTMPGSWLFALFCGTFGFLGFWGFAVLAFVTAMNSSGHWGIFLTASVVFFTGQAARAIMRQKMIFKLLASEAEKMRTAAIADCLGGPIWSLILLGCIISSAFGRTIKWRGIKYKLIGPTEVARI
ncbi:MAG: glycosyltransferase [Phycisphaerae bacterium]|nr:glycosyltransferase [Phycisphaerae bacterium]